jgi:hypothetical protein
MRRKALKDYQLERDEIRAVIQETINSRAGDPRIDG